MNFKPIKQQLIDLTSQGFKIAIIYARVSSIKQAHRGDSLEDQEKICKIEAKRQGYYVIKVFQEPYTGTTTERPGWRELLKFCKQFQEYIDVVFIFGLDRFNRAGAISHFTLKKQVAKYGVKLKDVTGIIQETRNSLEHKGFEYPWSIYSPSESAEVIKAQSDQDEVRNILTRLIGKEIDLVKKGYWVRPAPMGFKTEKIEDEKGKKRAILVPHEEESIWFTRMYEMRTNRCYSDQEIVDEINSLGYRSRILKKRDPNSGKCIGYMGGKELDVKRLQKIIARPIYAGIICEKWTNYKPIKAKFDGLVDIETWNKANKGKYKIVQRKDNSYQIIENPKDFPGMHKPKKKK